MTIKKCDHNILPPLISAEAPIYLKFFILTTSMIGQTTRDGFYSTKNKKEKKVYFRAETEFANIA
jgi:hypothetical protein